MNKPFQAKTRNSTNTFHIKMIYKFNYKLFEDEYDQNTFLQPAHAYIY